MSPRPPVLTSFLNTLFQTLEPRIIGSSAALVTQVRSKLSQPPTIKGESRRNSRDTASQLPPTVCTHLEPALVTAETGDPALAPLAGGIRSLASFLRWDDRPGGSGASPDFRPNHANAMIVGPAGFEARRDVWLGLSLLAPGTRYPDHDHAPPETYLVLSAGEFCQGGGDWISPGLGGTFHNPPGIRHAMRATSTAPLLALWLLDEPHPG